MLPSISFNQLVEITNLLASHGLTTYRMQDPDKGIISISNYFDDMPHLLRLKVHLSSITIMLDTNRGTPKWKEIEITTPVNNFIETLTSLLEEYYPQRYPLSKS